MARNYGVRYLTVDEFIRYCENLNVETDLQELEYYEKIGIMLPIARVIFPEEYIKQRTLWLRGVNKEQPKEDKWPGLERLFDKRRVFPKDYAHLTDEELIDSFDREIG